MSIKDCEELIPRLRALRFKLIECGEEALALSVALEPLLAKTPYAILSESIHEAVGLIVSQGEGMASAAEFLKKKIAEDEQQG